MPKVLGSLLSYADELVPNVIQTTTKIIFVNEAFKEIEDYITRIDVWSTQTVANQQCYSLPSGVEIRKILPEGVYVTDTTYNTTTIVSSTIDWSRYKFMGRFDQEEGRQFFEWTTGGTTGIKLGLYPIPDDVVYLRVLYRANTPNYTASSDSTSVLDYDDNVIQYVQNKVMAKICRASRKIVWSNNFEMEAENYLSKLKFTKMQTDTKKSDINTSYKAWW